MPTINTSQLKSLATNSGGKFASYQPSSADIAVFAPSANGELLKDEKQNHALWRIDAGIYGLLLLLPLSLYLFRRAALLSVFLVFSFLPQQNAYAVELPTVLKNTDQRALDAYNNKDYEQAITAQSSQLKGAALYQQGNFEAAVNQFSDDKSATGFYNFGNALAKAGKLEEAINAYQQAQALHPNFTQAADNQALVEQLLNQQQEQQNQGGGESQDGQKSDEQNQQQNSDEAKQDQQQNDEQGEAQSDSEKNSDDKSDKDSEQAQEQADQQNKPDMQAEPQNEQSENQPAEQPNDNAEQQSEPQAANEPVPDEQQQTAEQQAQAVQASELTNEEKEQAQQLNQLLRKVPDDPAILLRNKMQLEAQKRQYQRRPTGVEKSW